MKVKIKIIILVICMVSAIIIGTTIAKAQKQYMNGFLYGENALESLGYEAGKKQGIEDYKNKENWSADSTNVPEQLSFGDMQIKNTKLTFEMYGIIKGFFKENWKEVYTDRYNGGYIVGFEMAKNKQGREEEILKQKGKIGTWKKEADSSKNSGENPNGPPVYSEPILEKCDYVLNKGTGKFHYPSCSSALRIKISNREYYTGTRDEVIRMGYDPCERCSP